MRILMTTIMMLATAGVLAAQEPPQPLAGLISQLQVARGNLQVSAGTFGIISEQLIGRTPVKGSPYSAQAVTETIQTLADGNRITQKSTAMIYRDSLGRERREEKLPSIGAFKAPDDAPQIISISDPVAGVNYSLNTREHVAIKLPAAAGTFTVATGRGAPAAAPPSPPPPPPPPPPGGGNFTVIYRSAQATTSAPNVEKLGWRLIEGVQAEGTRTTITIPAGQMGNERPIDIVDEQWRSPDLQVMVLSRHSDPRFGETVYSLTNINRSDPPATLFQVPPDYTVQDKIPMDILHKIEGIKHPQ